MKNLDLVSDGMPMIQRFYSWPSPLSSAWSINSDKMGTAMATKGNDLCTHLLTTFPVPIR